MGRHEKATNDEVLNAIEVIRIRDGACSLRALCDEVGWTSTSTAWKRIERLVDEGSVVMNFGPTGQMLAGSIRTEREHRWLTALQDSGLLTGPDRARA